MNWYAEIKRITFDGWINIVVGIAAIGFVAFRFIYDKPLETDKLSNMAVIGIGFLLSGFVVLRQRQEKTWLDLFNHLNEIKRSGEVQNKISEHIFNLEKSSKKQEELLKNHLECISKYGSVNFRLRQDIRLTLIEEKLQVAKSAYFCGYSLDRLVSESEKIIHDCLKNGCETRFLIVSPNGEGNKLMKKCTKFRPIHQVQFTINGLKRIKDDLTRKGFSPNLQIRYIDWIPSCALYIVNEKEGINNIMQVEIYPPCFDTTAGIRPVFSLSENKNNESEWYNFFSKQFDSLWNQGTDVAL